MHSTFSRALIGFLTLSLMSAIMAYVALTALAAYAAAPWWGMLLVIAIALVMQFSVYASTLHSPIMDWIAEPNKIAEAKRQRELDERREDPDRDVTTG